MITFQQFNFSDYKDCLVVTDENVAKLYGIAGGNVYLLPQREQAKTFAEAEKLCRWFLSKNLERNGTVVAVGGGSVGDACGFAASVYKRGVKLIHVPTTLIAQTDSGIGGKTALNLGDVKNAVGTFYQADTVIDVDFLKTLPEAEMQSGYGEIIKYRMLCKSVDEAFRHGLDETIKACVRFKDQICREDTFDRNQRQKLNFGHTIGHAFELSCGISHGAAVANGLYYETELAKLLGLCDGDYAAFWQKEITGQFKVYPLTEERLKLTAHDKKNVNGQIGFVLPTAFDKVFVEYGKLEKLLKNA